MDCIVVLEVRMYKEGGPSSGAWPYCVLGSQGGDTEA